MISESLHSLNKATISIRSQRINSRSLGPKCWHASPIEKRWYVAMKTEAKAIPTYGSNCFSGPEGNVGNCAEQSCSNKPDLRVRDSSSCERGPDKDTVRE